MKDLREFFLIVCIAFEIFLHYLMLTEHAKRNRLRSDE